MSEMDWKAELRKTEREFSGLPPEPTAEEIRLWRIEEEAEQRRRDALNGAVGAWTRLLLVIALAAGLYFWPYARACGAGLDAFLGAEGAVVIGGVWVAWYSWRRLAARAHIASFVVALAGIAMIALEVLPRVGYAKPNPLQPATWVCAGGSASSGLAPITSWSGVGAAEAPALSGTGSSATYDTGARQPGPTMQLIPHHIPRSEGST
jgi:hypothetical protein